MTLRIMTLLIMTLLIITLRIVTLILMKPSITKNFDTLCNNIQHLV